jgi:hypothetical protein
VELAEYLADGSATEDERVGAFLTVPNGSPHRLGGVSAALLNWSGAQAAHAVLRALELGWHSAYYRANRGVRVEIANLIRDVFGNPFEPVAFDPSWRAEAVFGLARGMYESRDFTPMPVLADALEDAGCADADILAHCRGPGPHVRGCWVVDLVLGKV